MVDLKIDLPKGFLDEEQRCGFVVTSRVKEIWAVELDLLHEFQRVVNKYHIQYIANGGTQLGAVRHKGFIPWDDDIDIMMMRDESDRLCEVAEAEFRHPYFFQTERTDPGSLRCHAQMRNSETTAILDTERKGKMRFNQGIFIDIFPMDAVPDGEDDWNRECRKAQRLYENMLTFASMSSHFFDDPQLPHYRIKNILHTVAAPLWKAMARQLYNQYEKECKRYNHEATKMVSIYSWGYKYKKLHRPRRLFTETMMMQFEFLEVPVCKDYDEYLTIVFGDWHQFVMGTSMHQGILFDTRRPYTYYLSDAR